MLLTPFEKQSTQKSLGQVSEERWSLCNLNKPKGRNQVQGINNGARGQKDAGHAPVGQGGFLF